MTDARQALERQAAPRERRTILDLIERQAPAIERALPNAIGAERFTRIVLTEVKRNPALLDCEPDSLLGAMMLSAQLGLEPGPLGHVYLVPFKRQVTWILGYKGMVELARRSGHLRDVVARTVCEGDEFAYSFGLRDKLHHVPAPPAEHGVAVCYYGLARYAGGGHTLHVMYPEEIEARRKRSPAGRKGEGPWVTDYDVMARKSVLRAMQPYLPMSPTLARAVSADERGVLGLDDEAEPVIEGVVEEESDGSVE